VKNSWLLEISSTDGDELETHYRHMLESLGKEKGMLGLIFRKAQNKLHVFRMVAATNWGTWKLTGEGGVCDSVTSNEIAVCG
jgi:hypothetical protein